MPAQDELDPRPPHGPGDVDSEDGAPRHHRARRRAPSDGPASSVSGEVADQLSVLARQLQAGADAGQVLDEIVAAAIQLIPGADHASITRVTGRRRVRSEHHSGDLPRVVDALQERLGEGPCLDAVFEHRTVRVPDLASEDRWPAFAPNATAAGAAAMLSLQLYVEGKNLGGLNLYAERPRAFSDESVTIGLLFASHAAVALADATTLGQLRLAVDGRDVIGQAKGILMERHHLTADQAFLLLTSASQHSNRKLREVAEELTHSGQLPEGVHAEIES